MGILPSCSRVSTSVCLHHLDFDQTLEEIASWELLKGAESYFEQIQEAASYKTAALTFQLINYPNKTNKTCWALQVKFSYGLLLMDTPMLID